MKVDQSSALFARWQMLQESLNKISKPQTHKPEPNPAQKIAAQRSQQVLENFRTGKGMFIDVTV